MLNFFYIKYYLHDVMYIKLVNKSVKNQIIIYFPMNILNLFLYHCMTNLQYLIFKPNLLSISICVSLNSYSSVRITQTFQRTIDRRSPALLPQYHDFIL